jgi:hypothetical protein
MAIPWATALYVFRKVLPVVIDQAPELLKTLERRRKDAPPPAEPASGESAVAMLEERIDAQERRLETQIELLAQLQVTVRATRRSLTIVWAMLVVMLVAGSIAVAVLFRS